MAQPQIEIAVRHRNGIFECRDKQHAKTVMLTNSPALGPIESRVIVSREVSAWMPIEEDD